MLTEELPIGNYINIRYMEDGSEASYDDKIEYNYRLLEVADSNLLAALEKQETLWIRGGVEDDAVICTQTKTFRLRELVTSNMFLVVDTDRDNNSGLVVGRPSGTLEVTFLARPPGVDQLIKALNEAPYNGGNDEAFAGNSHLHVQSIYENIQASSTEIEQCLKSQGVMVINDHYRKLGNLLLCRFFELFFNTAILEDWNLGGEVIVFDRIWSAFQQYEDEFSSSLTQFIVSFYSDSENKLCLLKVSRFLAEQFLSARPVWDLEDFMAVWEKSLHDLFKPEFVSINDMVLCEKHPGSGRMEIRKYLRTDLPSDVDNRFIALFKTRNRWLYDELVPFISDLGRDSKELDAIILKHGRVSTVNGIRFITPRSQLLD